MVENQCESNYECVETQRDSGNNNVANECSCCCKQLQIKQMVLVHAVMMTLLMKQNHF